MLSVTLLPSLTIWVLEISWEMLCTARSHDPSCRWTPLMTVGAVMHSTSLETQGALSKSCSVFSALPDHVFLVNLVFFPPLPFSNVCFILLQYFPLLDFNVRIIALQARSNRRNAFLSQGLLICFGSAVCLQIPDYLPSLVNRGTKLPHLYLFFPLKDEIAFSVWPKMYLISILLWEYSRKF